MEYVTFAAVYDTAFQFRHAARAVDFIETCARTFGATPVRNVLDIACGTGHYAREFARRGYQTYGVDIDHAACAYARARAAQEALALTICEGDMVDFTVPAQCELALNLFDSLTYVTDPQQIVRHLTTVAKLLAPESLYIVEVGVIDQFGNHNVEEIWTEHRRDLTVTATYSRERWIDPVRQTFTEAVAFRASCREHAGFFVGKFAKFALSFEVFQRLLERAGCFVPLAYYEDFAPTAFLPKDEPPWRVIAVLRRKP